MHTNKRGNPLRVLTLQLAFSIGKRRPQESHKKLLSKLGKATAPMFEGAFQGIANSKLGGATPPVVPGTSAGRPPPSGGLASLDPLVAGGHWAADAAGHVDVECCSPAADASDPAAATG